MSAFPKYDRYKDSGVEWLGEVPEHWESEKGLRYFHETEDRSVTGEEELLSVSHLTGVTPRSEKNITMFLAESNVGSKVCEVGDIAVNTMWAWMAALGVSKYRGLVSPSYATYRQKKPERFNPTYIDHLLRSDVYKSHYMVNSTGITTSRLRLYPHSFLRLKFICPPREEQDRIVTFLDRKTAEIDALIAKKQRQIELLDEQKAILINRAVTRGLNPKAKLKPSGIEWIGDIPEGWEVRKFKHFFKCGMGETILGENLVETGIPVYSATEGGHYFGFVQNPKLKLNVGDLVIPARGNSIGHVKLVSEHCTTTQTTIYAKRIQEGILAEFALNFLTGCKRHLFQFTKTAIPQITTDEVKNNPLLVPPKNEQEQIAKHLKKLDAAEMKFLMEFESQIQYLKMLRSNLIAHAVTGKIKI